MEPMLIKASVQFLLFVLYLALVTFWPAGTLDYRGAWALIIVMLAGGVPIMLWLGKHDPALLDKRMSSPIQSGQEGWDRIFIVTLMLGFTAWLAFCAWDAARNGFAAVPPWLQAFGALFIAFYMWGAWLTFRENSFAAPVVKVQEGQRVIDTGPYALVRHPMYATALGLFIGVPLLLGSYWGLVGSALLIAGIGWRAVNEERVLRGALSGYEEYAHRVRWRLVPGVW